MAFLKPLDPDKYRLSEEKHEKIFQQEIIPELFAAAISVEKPTAVVFGGQPGSGKSASIEFVVRQLQNQGGCTEIVGDSFRNYHDYYGALLEENDKIAAFYTDGDSGRWVEKSIAHAKSLRCNIVVEGTMRVAEKVVETVKSLRAANYIVDIRVLAVHEKWSWQGVLQRYEQQKATPRGHGRMTTPEAHQAAYVGMLRTIACIESQKLADRITVYKRGALVLYENELQNDEWCHPPLAYAAIENERNRPWTLPERLMYAQGFDELLRLLERPLRKATEEEISMITELRSQAYQEIMIENVVRESLVPYLVMDESI